MSESTLGGILGGPVGRGLRGLLMLVAVLLLAWQAARLTWMLSPSPSLPASPLQVSPAQVSAVAGRADPLSRLPSLHLFGLDRPNQAAVPIQPAEAEAPETRLNLVLRGVIAVDQDRGQARAIIAVPAGDEDYYGIDGAVDGDSVKTVVPGNARVVDIQEDRVILLRNDRRETLLMAKEAEQSAARGAGVRRSPRLPRQGIRPMRPKRSISDRRRGSNL